MGIRGEIFTTKVQLQNRTYFFNVKENRMGDLYLNIVESKNKETGGFERQSIVLFAEDLKEFLTGFEKSIDVLEKQNREKHKASLSASNAYGKTNEKKTYEKRSEKKPPGEKKIRRVKKKL